MIGSRVTSVTVTASPTAPSRTTTYEHDEAGNIVRIVDPLGGITEQTFDAVGRLETRTLPNGVVSTWTYDARGWTDTIVHREPAADGGEVIASVDYTRSPSGEPTRIDREDGSYVLYDYDDSLRLTGEHHRDAGGGIVRNITYVYDSDGNRTQRIVQVGAGAASTVEDYAYSAGDLLETVSVEGTTVTDYDYDAAGRVVAIGDASPQALTWDADDHVTSLTEGPRTVRWTFDGDGRRLSRTEEVAGLTDREVGYATLPTLTESLESPHAVTDGSGNEQLGYVFAGEHPLFRFDPVTGEPVYYLQDGMGSVIGLVGDDAGTEVSTIHYDGFGNELRTTGTLATLPAASAGDFRFQGMWLDEGTGLYYVRARVYEAGTGRFLSRDPAEGRRTGPETYWPYVFAGSHPTVSGDSTGRFEVTLSGLQAGVVAAAILSVAALMQPGVRAGVAGGIVDAVDFLQRRLVEARNVLQRYAAEAALVLSGAVLSQMPGCVQLLEWTAFSHRFGDPLRGGPRTPAGSFPVNASFAIYFCQGPDAEAVSRAFGTDFPVLASPTGREMVLVTSVTPLQSFYSDYLSLRNAPGVVVHGRLPISN